MVLVTSNIAKLDKLGLGDLKLDLWFDFNSIQLKINSNERTIKLITRLVAYKIIILIID